MWELLQDLSQNEVFSGLVGSSLVVSILWVCKGIPIAAWRAANWRLTTVLVVYNEDPAFERVAEWLASLEYMKRARQLRLTTQERGDQDAAYWSPGLGKHLVWHKGRPILIDRILPKDSGSHYSKRRENLILTTFGTTPEFMHDLIKEILEEDHQMVKKKTEVYLYNEGYWRMACRKVKRPLSTVVIPGEQLQRILGYVTNFVSRRDWYIERGVPWRLGLLFKGPPGCGKTSLVLALAGHFNRPVYALNLGSLKGDHDLFEAVTKVPESALLLIEDVDAATVSKPRKTKDPDLGEEHNPLTLSGLLNALDGTFTKDGRILIMTTNHPENIDTALIRPGRADHAEDIQVIQGKEVLAMCQRFLGEVEGAEYAQKVLTITPAELQSTLLAKSVRD